jgi:hypothetical protein
MGRMVTLVLGLVVVAFIAYKVVYSRGMVAGAEAGPKPALDQVRKTATRIEDEQAKRLDETLQKTGPQE